jgi:hypothetical protein
MFSKPIKQPRFNEITSNEITSQIISLSDYIKYSPTITKMKMPELKYICKNNKLHVSGTKPVLIQRIHEYYQNCIFAIKLQKMVRGYFVRLSFKLRGIAYKNRKICTNTTDFYTMEPLSEIPYYKFYSYTDAHKFTYGFDIDSLIELYKKKGKITNPYNREKITIYTLNKILKLYRIIKMIYGYLDIVPVEEPSSSSMQNSMHQMNIISNTIIQAAPNLSNLVGINSLATPNTSTPSIPIVIPSLASQSVQMTEQQLSVIRERPLQERIIAVFMDIDQLGHYTDVSWFTNLEKRQFYNFFREIYNIWRFRAQLTYMTKYRICPYDPISNVFPALNYDIITIDTLKEGCLQIIENMVYMGQDDEYRNLGAFHVLTALTVISLPARTAMPWLYESIYLY